ncbi:uncharacterized protein LOC113363008 [Ctenocephalides felis]|uniref:uncharacterized protein LOC113363008 n=1 Tax=Ctenocephalides felis TaxID=7515 RepID=UPI000E6E3966|nr:uncharacterized protein LOC113363008 [Ctenocephalides felis]
MGKNAIAAKVLHVDCAKSRQLLEKWFANFNHAHTGTDDAERSGSSIEVTTLEKYQKSPSKRFGKPKNMPHHIHLADSHLGVWRYIAIAHPQKNSRWCRMETTIIAIAMAYVSCPLICIPLYLAFSIKEKREVLTLSGYPINNNTPLEDRKNATIYLVDKSELGRANGEMLLNVNFWIYSVVIKIIPCIALTVLSLRLIMALLETKKRRRKLMQTSNPNVLEAKQALNPKSSTKHSDTKERQTDRTTRMLLAVLLLFLITEFPQGILGLLSALLGNAFFSECYLKLGTQFVYNEDFAKKFIINKKKNLFLTKFGESQFSNPILEYTKF